MTIVDDWIAFDTKSVVYHSRRKMSITIPDEIIGSTRMTVPELKQEIAVMLFQKEKLTIGQASKLAEMNLIQFQHLLASRQIPVHYDAEDFEQDLSTLKQMNRL